MRPLRILTLAFLLFTLTAAAQTDRRIEEQKRVIAALEKRIATEEQEISKIQKGRTATEERVRRLARQIDSRNQLLDETEKQARLLRGEIARTDSVAGNLSAKLERDRAQYGEMVREAYRNYKHNNYLTYIFSSRDFTDVARKITALREVASLRERKLRDIEALTAEVRTEKETLDRRKRSLDSVTRSLSAQREKLQRDARNAHVQRLHDRLLAGLQQYSLVRVNSPAHAVPHIVNVSVTGVKGTRFQQALSEQGVCVSVKSACSSDGLPSKAVFAVSRDRRNALSSWRISISHLTTDAEIDGFLQAFDTCYKTLTNKEN